MEDDFDTKNMNIVTTEKFAIWVQKIAGHIELLTINCVNDINRTKSLLSSSSGENHFLLNKKIEHLTNLLTVLEEADQEAKSISEISLSAVFESKSATNYEQSNDAVSKGFKSVKSIQELEKHYAEKIMKLKENISY